MASLFDLIENDLKQSMRSRQEQRVSVLRMLLASLKNKKIDLRKHEDLSDEEVLGILKSEVKKRKDSIVLYQTGGRNDLAEKEEKEIEILEKYLPEQISDDEVEKIIEEVIESLGSEGGKNFGQIIGTVIKRAGGQVDGSKVSELVKKHLNK